MRYVLAVLLCGCTTVNVIAPGGDGGRASVDLARSDAAQEADGPTAPDLDPPGDLATVGDMASASDMAQPPPDLLMCLMINSDCTSGQLACCTGTKCGFPTATNMTAQKVCCKAQGAPCTTSDECCFDTLSNRPGLCVNSGAGGYCSHS